MRWQSPGIGCAFPASRSRAEVRRRTGAAGRCQGTRPPGTMLSAGSSPTRSTRRCSSWWRPSGKLPKGSRTRRRRRWSRSGSTRRAAPDGRILFDLVAEITQSCTVQQGGDAFDMDGGATVVIDPRRRDPLRHLQALHQRNRRNRQRAAIRGPLKDSRSDPVSTLHRAPRRAERVHLMRATTRPDGRIPRRPLTPRRRRGPSRTRACSGPVPERVSRKPVFLDEANERKRPLGAGGRRGASTTRANPTGARPERTGWSDAHSP